MCTGDTTWADIEDLMKRSLDGDRFGGIDQWPLGPVIIDHCYGLSKAILNVFTMQLATMHPKIMVNYKSLYCLYWRCSVTSWKKLSAI